jgi:hypothetical protein
MDCEQVLLSIQNDAKQLLQDNSDFADKLVSIDDNVIDSTNKLITAINQLNENLVTIQNTNVDTNSVSKAILNYLNKVQSFLKI